MPELSAKVFFPFYYLVSAFGVEWHRLAFNITQKQPDIHSTFARSDREHRRCQSAEQSKVNPNPSPTDFYSHTRIARCVSSNSIPFG